MRYIILLAMLIAVAVPACGAGFTNSGEDYTYTCSDSRPDVYGTNYYAWALRNESYVSDIVTWVWGGGQIVGGLPGSLSLEGEFPLARVTSDPRPWYNTFYESSEPSTVVLSTIVWADGHFTTVPIVMPRSVVPEPAGILLILCGTASLAAARRRRAA